MCGLGKYKVQRSSVLKKIGDVSVKMFNTKDKDEGKWKILKQLSHTPLLLLQQNISSKQLDYKTKSNINLKKSTIIQVFKPHKISHSCDLT